MRRRNTTEFYALGLAGFTLTLAACGSTDSDADGPGDSPGPSSPTPVPMAEVVYIAHDVVKDADGNIVEQGTLVGMEVATGDIVGSPISNIESPYGMQVLEDGTVLVNLTNRTEILVVDGETMTELSRIPASNVGATRPVDSLLSPEHDGQSYWLTLNDGANTPETNSAVFIDTNPNSENYLKLVGEVLIGIGHHQAAFSSTQERVAITNFSDCSNIVSVYDYSDPSNIQLLETLTAVEAGYDNSTTALTCDTTETEGVSIRPHGCATSLVSGKAYCNATTNGKLFIIDMDADPPTFKVEQMSGTGGGYVKAGEGGEYIYTVQSTPREGNGGADCQIGQLLVIDASSDAITETVPMFYKGPDSTDVLTGTDESASQANHLKLSKEGDLLFVALAPSFGASGQHVRQQVVYDLSNPASPIQLDSVPVGSSYAQRGTAVTGDGKFHYVTNLDDGTVTEIDVKTLQVTRTIVAEDYPKMVASFGTKEGPSLPVGPVH